MEEPVHVKHQVSAANLVIEILNSCNKPITLKQIERKFVSLIKERTQVSCTSDVRKADSGLFYLTKKGLVIVVFHKTNDKGNDEAYYALPPTKPSELEQVDNEIARVKERIDECFSTMKSLVGKKIKIEQRVAVHRAVDEFVNPTEE